MENIDIIETQKRIIDTLFQNVEDAIIVVDTKRNITHYNKSAENIIGFRYLEVINKPVEQFLNIFNEKGKITIDTCCPLGDINLDGVFFKGDNVKLITKDQDENIVNFKSIKIQGGNNVNVGCIFIIQDTFAQSELERMKLDFVSMAEHVLRTPITVIKGYVSRLLEDRTTKKLEENEINYLHNCFTGTTELLTTIEDLLNITEIRKGQVKLNKTALNIEGVLLKIVSEFKMVAADKGIQISFIPPYYQLPMVYADITKIQIVLQNLMENALKYTDEGKIEVIISHKEECIEIAVKDTGKGIPPEYIGQLFTKFYRVKKALEMDYGLGLGLYICREIIEAHGGKIWVDSKAGEGSTFTFSLPVFKEVDGTLGSLA